MEYKTTIQVFLTTKHKLRMLGERNEDYDSIINRILEGDIVVRKQKKEVVA